jgi:hypothetical protein
MASRIQEKIDTYTNILLNRYPPGVQYYKISIGHVKTGDAVSDTTPHSSIFTSDDSQPATGSTIFTDQGKTIRLKGADLYYHVFAADGVDLSYIIRINSSGIVTFQS